jgi:glycosyltransferase involved in cell wall biosynthesis
MMMQNSSFSVRRKHFNAPSAPPGVLRIGVLEPNYGLEKVSYSLISNQFTHYYAGHFKLRHFDRSNNFFQQTPFVITRGHDLIHCWNSVPRNSIFVTTTEMEFPRLFGSATKKQFEYVFNRIESKDCRGIWPLSEAARRHAMRRFEECGRAEFGKKLTVFRGAVTERPAPPDFSARYAGAGPLRVLFVGRDGLRKGLYPVVTAVSRLIEAGAEITLTIVGQFTRTTYFLRGIEFNRPEIIRLAREAPWATVHDRLPNADVRALMDTHDVLAFPTFDESLGWVPVEAAMSGVPTIASNVFAIPEFVAEGETGWVTPFELDDDLRWRHRGNNSSKSKFEEAEKYIEERIVDILSYSMNNPGIIKTLGEAAYRRAKEIYSPIVVKKELESLYRYAIEGAISV